MSYIKVTLKKRPFVGISVSRTPLVMELISLPAINCWTNCTVLKLYSIDIHLTHQQPTAFEKNVDKEENCSERAISSFPTVFSTQSGNCILICPYF